MKKLQTPVEHRAALSEVEKLMRLQPKANTRQGKRLVQLATAVEAYEKIHYPIPTDKSRGVYRKYKVTRTDGSSRKGGKHENCAYYVLDLEHDEFALPALRAYAKACKKQFPALAKDLLDILDAPRPCGCRAVGECLHQFFPKTPNEKLAHKLVLSEEP